ncbi:hypothetical protein C0Q70_09868 [Pomacea canaliculata]|uniref:F-box domain-containing protein n=1 Tax=Pomacea canaliculata TaxID=400727 RepID=A0A2T7PB07_POMCA|nr:hypothetical protein C0Q70_09868 [Pomacea canaliculata]
MVSTRRTAEVSHWHLMPVDILTTVFALLPEKDRCQAGLVCKAWNAVVNTPHLWRHHTFSFRGTNGKEAWRACKFVESALGAHVLHMEANILDCPLFPVEMRRFDSLRHLCLNHSYVNDDVLDNLTNPSNTLRVLQLQVEVSQYIHLIPLSTAIPSKSVLTSAGWRSAAGRCPLLRVFITMKATFHINWSEMGAIWPYEADLVRLFRQCRFLSDVILTMRVPVDTLLNIHKAVVAEKRGRMKLQIAGLEPPLMENFCLNFPYITVKHLGD